MRTLENNLAGLLLDASGRVGVRAGIIGNVIVSCAP